MKTRISALVLIAAALAGCADMTPRQQRALSGGAIGAAGGAAFGLLTGGGVLTGALVGGGAGTAVGALMPDDSGKHRR